MNAADCLELSTAGVSHALDRLDIDGQALGIAALNRAFRCAGQAFTIRMAPAGATKGGSNSQCYRERYASRKRFGYDTHVARSRRDCYIYARSRRDSFIYARSGPDLRNYDRNRRLQNHLRGQCDAE